MMEPLMRAASGPAQFFAAGKLPALLIAVLLLIYVLKKPENAQKDLFIYGAVLTALCIFPVTAMLLCAYQTRFYDYQFIWTLVPMTALIACGATALYQVLKDRTGEKKLRRAVVCIAVLAVMLLCGRLGNPQWTVPELAKDSDTAKLILEAVKGQNGEEICLWAPQEIMAQARTLDGSIRLVYGRNMWQEHANAFSYDIYDQDQKLLYIWMVMVGNYGTADMPGAKDVKLYGDYPEIGDVLYGEDCIRAAMNLGVNRIVLPGNVMPETLKTVGELVHADARQVGDYYVFTF